MRHSQITVFCMMEKAGEGRGMAGVLYCMMIDLHQNPMSHSES